MICMILESGENMENITLHLSFDDRIRILPWNARICQQSGIFSRVV